MSKAKKSKSKLEKTKKIIKNVKEESSKPKEFKEIIGFGKFEFPNKIIYIGGYRQLKTGQKLREGYGKLTHPTNDNSEIGQEYYEGYWKDDMMEGYGIYHYSNGDVYEGNWHKGLQSGYGNYSFTDGHFYSGEWKDHQMHGTGKYHDLNGSGFDGEFRFGNYFSKEQSKLKEEKKILKKIAKRKVIPFNQFFKTWEDTIERVDKKNCNELLSFFFAKNDNMGMFFKDVKFPEYEDYTPEYWNDAIRWAFCQEEKKLVLNKPKSIPKKLNKKTSNGSAKNSKSVSKTNLKVIIPNVENESKIKINVPKNGSELIVLNPDALLVAQLQDEVQMSSGQVIEMITTQGERTISLAIGYNSDLNRWLLIYFNDNQAPPKEQKKTKKGGKSKSKSKKK